MKNKDLKGIEIKATSSEGLKKVCKITATKDRLVSTEEEWIKEASEEARIPGFRKGQIPRKVLVARLESWIKEQTSQELFKLVVEEVRRTNKFSATEPPAISDIEYDLGKNFSFVLSFEVEPEFSVAGYTNLALKRMEKSVKDEEVDAEFEKIINNLEVKYLMPREKGHKFDFNSGDWAIFDAIIKNDSKTMWEASHGILSPEEECLPNGLREAISGMTCGESKELAIATDDDSPVENLKGKNLHLSVKLHEIKVMQLNSELNPAQEPAGSKLDKEKIKETIKQNLEARLKHKQDAFLREQIISALLGANPLDVKQSEIDHHVDHRLKRSKAFFAVSKKELSKEHEEELKVKYKAEAVNDIRLAHILGKIAQQENIRVEDQDFNDLLTKIPSEDDKQRLIYNKAAVMDEILEDKIFKYILSKSQIEKVEV
ncbi:trigger factor [Elusimicrobiota bacterium]